ncbi:RNA polymerase sigma-70 factor [Chitinophaga sp. MM2321]|uniref:RNA polymerase sigma-70 factor n=1 Tax=Chitinophaga sp. MM2321 TaxID=3137178 RepID=UPI0032D56E32
MISSLFTRLAGGDAEKALEELHHGYFHALFRFVYAIVRCKETSEEIVNDVFITLWKRRAKLADITNPEVYLFVCAKNAALKYLQSKRITYTDLDELPDFSLKLERNPEEILISSEMLLHINKTIDQLPPKCKMIFLLAKQDNLKYREVAEVLQLSEKTVENQLVIALKKISNAIPFYMAAARKK